MTNDSESVKAVAMKKRVSLWAIAATCALISSCSAPSRESPPEIRWRFKGPARFADPLSAKPSGPDTAAEETSRATTTERDGFLPLMLFDGMEYEAAPEDADILRELMRSVATRRSSQPAPAKSSSDTESSNHAVIVGNGDTRASLYGPQVLQEPFRYVGFLEGVGERTNPDGDVAGGYCTCVKMINHAACVTAAHCVNTGPAPEDEDEPKNSWRPTPNVTFLATADAPMDTLDAAVTKYAVIIPMGYLDGTSKRDYDFAVLRFRGDAHPVTAEVDPDGPPVPQVPFEFFDMGTTGYARNGPDFLDLAIGANQEDIARNKYTPVAGNFFIAAYPGPVSAPASCQGRFPCLAYAETSSARGYPGDPLRLHYVMDTTGGMSGGPVFLDRGAAAGSDRYRVVAIHSGRGNAVKVIDGDTTTRVGFTNTGVLMTAAVDIWLTWASGGAGRVFAGP